MSAEDWSPRIRVGLGDAPLLRERKLVLYTKYKLRHDSSPLVLQSCKPHRMESVGEGAGGHRYNRPQSTMRTFPDPLSCKHFFLSLLVPPRDQAASNFSTHWISWVIPSGLEITASIPTAEASDFPTWSPNIENKTIGTCGIALLITEAASAPFMRGISKSKSTKSGLSFLDCSIASTPSTASPQTSYFVWILRNVRIRRRTPGLSSAIRMHFDMGTLVGAHKFPANTKSKSFVYATQYIVCCRGRFAVDADNEEV